ncbi:pilus assembly protein N-terminal domain-containing protein [Phenylobacterium aquaticum]|uniref:pilus assembly protein N-terminal domain-containing protein n=1 Tax=Phenylobacterium aquaticum TaxID=1763816 RepID=UPI001F5CE6D1|nr:pilus assembly protein N-terminal domain-containing protein [Phenylobacterium aquaticum]MCI3135365.1 pilus assembly protein N-terminal domain-containing protein [Phenylobacterium aquaticum]
MRRRLIPLAIAAIAAAGLARTAQAETLSVLIDQSARLSLPAGAQTVMVGNPAIADVNLLDSHNAVLLGRAYGVTNLLVTDVRGRVLMDRQVVVAAPQTDRVTMFRGGTAASPPGVVNYACAAARCERTPMPGENDTDYSRVEKPYIGYADRAASAAKHP